MSAPPPNVLVVIADDFGVQQLGCTDPRGAGFFSTPHLDRLAAEGVRFAHAYATAPVCSPARASLYTGLHPARLHVTDFIPGSEVINPPLVVPDWQRGLPVSAVTIADVLKARGYATAHFGKWHLAPDYEYVRGRPMDPESQGFDEVFVTRKPSPDANPETDCHHIGVLTDRALEFCTRRRDHPFLCVLAHNALHRPELAPAALMARFSRHPAADPQVNRPALGAMVAQMDAAMGRLLAALRERGRERDTMVVFTSDHGPLAPSELRKPLRGAKADLYEAGIRVPLLLRWPERIAPGQVCDEMVTGMDLFPTLLNACGGPAESAVDGLDLWPLIRGKVGPLGREAMHWHYPHYHHLGLGPCGAIRAGDYKLIEWFGREPAYELFNVTDDPSETRNLATTEPARCAELAARLRQWRQSIGAQEMRPNPGYDPAAPTRILPPATDRLRPEIP
jgi:arylsulfatase A